MILWSIVVCVFTQTLYQILQVSEQANEQQIKKAFRKLSGKYHPDKNKGDQQKNKRYLLINQAYQILTDSLKKQTYDLYGQQGIQQLKKGKHVQKGQDSRFTIFITLEEAYLGAIKTHTFKRQEICKKCKGSGDSSGKMDVCPKCRGQGFVLENIKMHGMTFQMNQQCNMCGGKGRKAKNNCPVCSGRRLVVKPKQLKVVIQKGVSQGSEYFFRGESQQAIQKYPGDVVFTIKIRQHNRFRRDKDNLYTDLRIQLHQAILGFRKTIKHLDNHQVVISNDDITQNQQKIVIVGEGMPLKDDPTSFGDLIVTVRVNFPTDFTESQKEHIRKIYAQKVQQM